MNEGSSTSSSDKSPTLKSEGIATQKLRRFSPYPQYRDSRLPWLGKVPSHWTIGRLKRLVRFQGGGTPAKGDQSYWSGEIPWVSPKDMKSYVITDTMDRITSEAIKDSATNLVSEGSVLIVVRSGILKHTIPVAIAGCSVALNQDMKALIPTGEIRSEYLSAIIQGLNGVLLLEWRQLGATVESLDSDLIANGFIPVPGIDEQDAIVKFIYREIAKIDALIAKKQRLIELLKEKRTALITRAVTKGLDPHVLLKDSGVEWLGKIPAHWEAKRIAMAVDKITNGYVGPTRGILADDGVRYLQSLHIKGGAIDFFRKPYYVSETWCQEHSKSVLRQGDILVVQTGDIGQVAVVPKEFDGCNCHALIILRLKADLGSGSFVARVLQSHYGQNALKWSQTGALHPHLECGHVREISIVLPPFNEQTKMLRYLEKQLDELDILSNKVLEGIDRLQEFRTALISAAVTGKIDVRDEISPEELET